MDGEIEFNTPVLLATPQKYRYLIHADVDLPSTAFVSDLSNSVIRIAYAQASYLGLDLDSDIVVEVHIYKLVDSLGPVDDHQPTATLREQFGIIDDVYLYAKAYLLASTRRLHRVTKPENMVAVLRLLPPRKRPRAGSESQEAIKTRFRDAFTAAAGKGELAPSIAAKTCNMIKRQQPDRSDCIYNARPLDLNAAPIRIYHPAFTQFLDRIATPYDKLPLTPGDWTTARALVAVSAKYYDNEDDRVYAIEEHLRGTVLSNTLPSIRGHTGRGRSFMQLGNHYGVQNTSLVMEVKNEIGDGGCNPAAQAMFDYVSFVVHPKRARLREVSCCPAFLVAIAGQHVSVHGAIFADQLVVQALTDYITFGAIEHIERPPSGSDNNQAKFGRTSTDEGICRAARLLYALRLGVQELEGYYQQLNTNIPSAPPRSDSDSLQHFPFLTTLQSEAYGELILLYLCRIAKDDPSKAVFGACMTTTNGDTREQRPVVVKFTPSYNGDAHALLAGLTPPLAPKMWHCKWENEVGMFVVVMDLVEGKTFEDEVLSDVRDIGSLRTAVQALHEKNWVFGDLRTGNVLVAADGVRLIDFDWCKMDGQGRYPADINMDDIKWHPDVNPGSTMKKVHDAFMFEVLTKQKL